MAVQRYSASPVKSSEANINIAAKSAASMAEPASAQVKLGAYKLPKNCEMVLANIVVPTSVTIFSPTMTPIQPHRPVAIFISVRLSSSIFLILSL